MQGIHSGRRAIALGTVALLAAAAWPAAANAAGSTFALKAVSPAKLGYFVVAGRPGTTVRGAVQVINVGTSSGRTRLYAVDATTGQTSGAVYRSKEAPRRDVGTWVDLGSSTIELGPGESRVVPFSVRVPRGASPGQHLGGIVAERSTSTSSRSGAPRNPGTFKVTVKALSVVAVQVNVPGPQRVKLSLSGVKVGDQPGHQSLLLGIGNPGNVLLKGSGSLKVVNHSGRLVQGQRFNLDTFVPETHIDFPVYIQGKALRPGRYRATVSLQYRGRSITRVYPFTLTAADTTAVFGSHATQIASGGSPGGGAVLFVLAGVAALSLGAAGFFFMRTRSSV